MKHGAWTRGGSHEALQLSSPIGDSKAVGSPLSGSFSGLKSHTTRADGSTTTMASPTTPARYLAGLSVRDSKDSTERDPSPSESPTAASTLAAMSEPFSSQRAPIKDGELASKCVWVGNVAPEISQAQFRKQFEEFGEIELVRMFPRSKCAFVTYKKAESAVKSLTLEGKLLGSMCLTLNIGKASRHLWVGNIGPHVTELDLRTVFELYGTVESVRVLRGNKCAFVNYSTESEALAALEAMNGKSLGNQEIVINFQWENSFKRPGRARATQPATPTTGSKAGATRYPPGISRSFEIPSRQLFVGSIVPSVTDGTLWHLFSRFGEVEQIKGYANRGYAFIVFRNLQVAIWVREQMKLFPPTIGGRALVVNFGRQPTTNPGEDYPYPVPTQPLHIPSPGMPGAQPSISSTLPVHVSGAPVPITTQYPYPPPGSLPLSIPTLPGYVMASLQAPGEGSAYEGGVSGTLASFLSEALSSSASGFGDTSLPSSAPSSRSSPATPVPTSSAQLAASSLPPYFGDSSFYNPDAHSRSPSLSLGLGFLNIGNQHAQGQEQNQTRTADKPTSSMAPFSPSSLLSAASSSSFSADSDRGSRSSIGISGQDLLASFGSLTIGSREALSSFPPGLSNSYSQSTSSIGASGLGVSPSTPTAPGVSALPSTSVASRQTNAQSSRTLSPGIPLPLSIPLPRYSEFASRSGSDSQTQRQTPQAPTL